MTRVEQRPSAVVASAMVCSGVVTAQFIAGKATRDALYLAVLDVTTLPAMIVATSAVSILLVVFSSKVLLRRQTPATFVPLTFVVSALLFLVEWALVGTAPRAAAVAVYLQVSGLGPMLGSGLWLILSERFDPRSAKRHFGQIAGAGTLGGLAGGLLAERAAAALDVAAMLPLLAGMSLVGAWLVRRLAVVDATATHRRYMDIATDLSAEPARSGLRVLASTTYLRDLAALVLLGTAAAALVDYVFKAQALASVGRGESLLRFFGLYYAAVGVITFIVQAVTTRYALEKFGLAVSAGTPSMALLAGGAAALVSPGLTSAVVARGSESVFRGSLFRSGYEIFYTPILPGERRAAKSLIDVGFDRVGDAVGAALVRSAIWLAPAAQWSVMLSLAMACSAAALIVSRRLTRGYIQTLERNLLNRGLHLELSDVQDLTTRHSMFRTLATIERQATAATLESPASDVLGKFDVDMLQMLALRSRNRERVLRVLRSDEPMPATLVPHVIALLSWDAVAADAVQALRRVAEPHVGQFVDALVDAQQDDALRRRVGRVLSSCPSQAAADGLMRGLRDERFDVRFQCARSLAAIVKANAQLRIDREALFEIVEHELVRDRASRSIDHLVTILSLVLPAEPLRIAFQGLRSGDPGLRGTAQEYLEGVLPPAIRDRLINYTPN
jgi:AAA family ATP:ADP antiporter